MISEINQVPSVGGIVYRCINETAFYAAIVPFVGTGIAIFYRLPSTVVFAITTIAANILPQQDWNSEENCKWFWDQTWKHFVNGCLDIMPGVKLILAIGLLVLGFIILPCVDCIIESL